MNLVLPLPPLGNHYKKLVRVGRGVRWFRTKETERFLKTVRAQAHGKPLTGLVAVNVRVFRKHKRGDIDGWLKVSLDSLQGVAFRNDSQVRSLLVVMTEDKENPRLVVDVFPWTPPEERQKAPQPVTWADAARVGITPDELRRSVRDNATSPELKAKIIALATPNYRGPRGL